MSSPPSPCDFEGLIAEAWGKHALDRSDVMALLEPYREVVDHLMDDFDDNTQSWRDYSGCIWGWRRPDDEGAIPFAVQDAVEELLKRPAPVKMPSPPRAPTERPDVTDPSPNLPRFLCDVDGVLANFIEGALPLIEEITGTRYVPEDFTTWDLFDVVPMEHKTACYNAFKRPGFCAGLAPFPGIKEGLKQLKTIADVRIVTSPIHGPHWYFERVEWIDRHLGIREKHVVFRAEKEFEEGDFLLDDRPSHVEKWAKRHPRGLGLLWHQLCNASDDLPARMDNVARVSSWEEVLTYVGRLGSP